jgi:hypothetical protein
LIALEILPAGIHTVEVAVLDELGNGELFLRDLELQRNDWFYVGLADVTYSENRTSGPADLLQGENAPYDYDSDFDGRKLSSTRIGRSVPSQVFGVQRNGYPLRDEPGSIVLRPYDRLWLI